MPMMVLGFQPLFKTGNTSYKSNRPKITLIFFNLNSNIWTSRSTIVDKWKKRGLISWLVLKKATSGKSTWCGTRWWCHGLAHKLTVGNLWGNGLPNGLMWNHTASNTTWRKTGRERKCKVAVLLQRNGKNTAQPAMWKSPGWEWQL